MSAAIFGLIGFVVGDLITAGIEGFYRWRDAKHRRRQAARLVQEELTWLGTAIDLIKKDGDPSKWEDPAEIVALWQTEREALVDLPYEDWRVIERAMRMLSSMHHMFTDPALLETATPEQIVSAATDVSEQIDPRWTCSASASPRCKDARRAERAQWSGSPRHTHWTRTDRTQT